MVATAGALVLISERTTVTRAGYRVAELEVQRRRLVEQNRRLGARVARLKSAAHIIERAKSLQLDVVPPEERLKEQLDKAASSR